MSDKSGSDNPVLVLFRTDLRIADNGALAYAADSGRPVIPVFVFDDESKGLRKIGGARRWWLHKSLERLTADIEKLGGRLILRAGEMREVAEALVAETGADSVYWNRRYWPVEHAIDDDMASALMAKNIETKAFDGMLLHDPAKIRTKTGGFYKVYTPFWRTISTDAHWRDPIDAPDSLIAPAKHPGSEKLADWKLLPTKPNWATGFEDFWEPGETAAHDALADFLQDASSDYGTDRDRPDRHGTSRLSPHLLHGEITPFQVMAEARHHSRRMDDGLKTYLQEIGWREFCHHLLWNFPKLGTDNFNGKFDQFKWRASKVELRNWETGKTGYPMVDAGMRELWRTGWMHNRVRMIVASFLCKDLRIDWRDGEEWFWDTLVDADPASNTANWQWVAGSGADASPYFRIFNPITQGKKFDPEGDYIRRNINELSDISNKFVHEPWKADESDRNGYAPRIVDHGKARDEALATYQDMKQN